MPTARAGQATSTQSATGPASMPTTPAAMWSAGGCPTTTFFRAESEGLAQPQVQGELGRARAW
jgi:hypothetical protein